MQYPESSGIRMYEDTKKLAALGDRTAGSKAEWEAAEMVKGAFKEGNFEVVEETFEFPSFYENSSKVKVITPKELELDARAMFFSPHTPEDGLRGELVYLNKGGGDDYKNVDVEGKIVIFHRDKEVEKDHFWPEVSLASRNGATGVILINFNTWEFITTLETGFFEADKRLLPVEPNPIPAVVLGSENGDKILQLMEEGKVTVDLFVDTENKTGESANIRGIKKGIEKPNEKIIIYGHRDSVGTPGANDNGSGTVIMMELARILKDVKLKRTVEILSTGAEEQLGALGGIDYLERHKENLHEIKAGIEMDMVGGGNSLWVMEGGDWPDMEVRYPKNLCKFVYEKARESGYAVEYGFCTFGTPDSGKFAAAGVPTTWLWGPDDIHYHSPEDTPDKVDPNKLKIIADMTARVIIEMDKLDCLDFLSE